MEFKEIQDLLKLVNKTNLTEVEIEKQGFKIRIRRKMPESNVIYTTQQAPAISSTPIAPPVQTPVTPSAAPQNTTAAKEAESGTAKNQESDLYTFKSPMIGTFYRSSSPDAPPFAKVGDEIHPGQVLCIIEAMKLFNEIESEVAGKVVKVLVENAQPVEYDQPLFLIEPA